VGIGIRGEEVAGFGSLGLGEDDECILSSDVQIGGASVQGRVDYIRVRINPRCTFSSAFLKQVSGIDYVSGSA